MKLLELYNGSLFDCQMIKNLLDNSGIESFLKDEIIGTRSPVWTPGAGVRVMVSDTDFDNARMIVLEYESNKL